MLKKQARAVAGLGQFLDSLVALQGGLCFAVLQGVAQFSQKGTTVVFAFS